MSVDPSKLILQNQFGEESINNLMGSAIPLVQGSNIVLISGSGAPTDGVTGVDVADTGSLYIRSSNGALYYNSGDIDTPAWTAIGAGTTSTLLTGFVAGAGVVAASDTVLQGFDKVVGNQQALQNGTLSPSANLQTLSAAGAISTTVLETLINNATSGTFVMTLAAPSSQDGQFKIIKLGTATTHGATLAMTNIVGPGFCTLSGTTTLTFAATGDCVILMAVGAKWQLMGGNAIAS